MADAAELNHLAGMIDNAFQPMTHAPGIRCAPDNLTKKGLSWQGRVNPHPSFIDIAAIPPSSTMSALSGVCRTLENTL